MSGYGSECKTEEERRDLRKKAEGYLARAEQLKQLARDKDGKVSHCSVVGIM